MLPQSGLYEQIHKDSFLQHRVAVSEVIYDGPGKQYEASAYANATSALSEALGRAQLLAPTSKNAYLLSASVKDATPPKCFMGACDNGSAIEYTLSRGSKAVWQKTIVVPHSYQTSIFIEYNLPFIQHGIGGAIAENYSQLIQELTRLKSKDMR